MNTFPLNAWYACAYDVEVKHELLARTVCKQKLVMYRKLDGTVAILEDAWWHRLLPLSKGRLDGDQVTCGYHGLVYSADGALHSYAVSGNDQPVGLRALLPGRREAPLRLGLARRGRAGRPGTRARHALERRPSLGR